MDRAIDAVLRDETLAVLTERTEGWAVGLRLAALMLRNGGDVDHQVAQLHAENRYVMDYLMSEVLAHVPPEMEDFLVKTSILDRLCGPLCDAVMQSEGLTPHGQANLQWLEDANLFTMCLDEERLWYRYHHLFHGLLRSRLERTLDADEIAALHLPRQCVVCQPRAHRGGAAPCTGRRRYAGRRAVGGAAPPSPAQYRTATASRTLADACSPSSRWPSTLTCCWPRPGLPGPAAPIPAQSWNG